MVEFSTVLLAYLILLALITLASMICKGCIKSNSRFLNSIVLILAVIKLIEYMVDFLVFIFKLL